MPPAYNILGYRDTSRARIFLLEVAGREVRIKKLDHDPDEPQSVTRAFIEARLDALIAARQALKSENDQEEATISHNGFRQWLSANINDRRVRKLLRPLVRIYLDEGA